MSQTIEEKIKYYADNYYQGNELISDQEFDALIAELRKQNPNSELLPENQGIAGSDLKGISKKYKLPVTMGTLAKCNSDEEFKKWWSSHQHTDIVAQTKLDGCSCLLEYKDGEFVRAYSRGNSEYGEDRTKFIQAMEPNFLHLKIKFSGWIRGEIYLKRSVFNERFNQYKNPRNCCAGILGREDDFADCKYLSFIAYDVFQSSSFKGIDDTEMHKLDFLSQNNFEIPKFMVNPTIEQLKEWKDSIDPNTCEIPCDGVVIKQNKTNKEDLMRRTPLYNVAYKPALQTAISTLTNIEWNLAGRYVSPVAIIEPVELEGTTVSRASLANLNIMRDLGVHIGCQVAVSKHGLIIPQVDDVLDPIEDGFEIPGECPVCHSKLVENSSGILECINEDCPNKQEHRIAKFFDTLGIKGGGDKFIENLVKAGNDFKSLIFLVFNDNEFCLNEFAGGINGEKIYKQIKEYLVPAKKQITLSQLFAFFDDPLLGEKQFNKLGDLTLDEIYHLRKVDLININGIGDEIADRMISFFKNNRDDIYLLKDFFNIKAKKTEEKKEGMETICFTGACPGYTRKQLTELCAGKYEVVDSVTKDLNILACADPNSGSSKLQKAAKNGTKVISYEQLLENLDQK